MKNLYVIHIFDNDVLIIVEGGTEINVFTIPFMGSFKAVRGKMIE